MCRGFDQFLCLFITPPVPRDHHHPGVGLSVLWRGVQQQGADEGPHPAALRGEAEVAVHLHLLWTGVQERVPTESTQGEVVQGQALGHWPASP